MAQNLASTYQKEIDEVFRLKSVTSSIINNGVRLTFNGVNSVSIYGVATVAEGNYVRSGSNRFGSLAELDTTKQTFVLSQDKAFTYTIDRGNLQDSMMVQEAGSTLKRQIEVVCVPNTDIYRLTTLHAYAVAQSFTAVGSGTTSTSSTAYGKFLAGQTVLDNKFVPVDGRVVFATPEWINLLKQDAAFTKPSDIVAKNLINGQVGEIDGCPIVKVPSSYLPAKAEYMIVHKDTLVAPTKFETFRTLDNVQGIDGWVVEGRRYYDAFIPTNAGKGIVISQTA
jgi:N4-gp56 family major capsid protein